MIKVQDTIKVWWSPGTAKVLNIKPYTGDFPEYFNCILVLENTNTETGYTEMPYKDEPIPTNDMQQAQEEEAEQLEKEDRERERTYDTDDIFTNADEFERWWKHIDMDEDYIRGFDDGEEPKS